MIRSTFDSTTGVATLTLDRPEKKNALTPSMLDGLSAEIDQIRAKDQARAVLLIGEGDTFCAGFDLVMCRDDERVLPALLTGLSRVARLLRRLPMPVTLGVQGSAIAGGCALLGGADLVVTHDSAKLGYPVVRLGISPAVTAPLLRLALADGPTRQRLLGGSLFTGQEAVTMGLAHESLSEAGAVVTRAKILAEELARKPSPAIAATKSLLNDIEGSSRDGLLDAAMNVSLALANSDERRRLLSVFLDKTMKPSRL